MNLELHINQAAIWAFTCAGIPFQVIENPFFIELLQILRSGYMLPSRDNLLGKLFAQEMAVANQQIIKELKNSTYLILCK